MTESTDAGGNHTTAAAAMGGCLTSVISAVITVTLLFTNGSFVLAVVSSLARNRVAMMENERVAQFLIFTMPVIMVVIQWCMIDYLRRRFTRS